jgi:hypothetical protein
MATARKVLLSPHSDTGVWSTGISESAAKTASAVLQEDLEKHHVYFNDMGFHDHIVHQILTLYALGASPDEIQAAYDRSKTYQRQALPTHEDVVKSLHQKDKFKDALGKENNYPDFLEFFQREIDEKGIEAVLSEYLFKQDENAESMMARLFGGTSLYSCYLCRISRPKCQQTGRPAPPHNPPRLRYRVQSAGHYR